MGYRYKHTKDFVFGLGIKVNRLVEAASQRFERLLIEFI